MNKALERATNKYPALPPRAAMVADFIETYCTLTKADGGLTKVSDPFVLIPWQLEVLADMFPGPPFEPNPIRRAIVSTARKSGKTEFASALVLVYLCGPEAITGGQIVCAAPSSQDQAKLVFDGAQTMALNSHKLRKYIKIRTNRIIWEPKGTTLPSYVKTVSTSESSIQGLLPHFFTFDEIAEAVSRSLYEGLNYAQPSGGMGLIISTRSTKPNSLFTELHDEAVRGLAAGTHKYWVVKVWSADPKASNLYTMEQVRAANPSLGYINDETVLEQALQNAVVNVSARSDFRARILNIESGTNDALVDPQMWVDAALEPKPIPWETSRERMMGKKAVMSIDLGSTRSMTSIALYFPGEKYIVVRNWMAKSQARTNETLHKNPYFAWAELDYITLIDSGLNDGMSYEPIAAFIAQCHKDFDLVSIRFDPWSHTKVFDILATDFDLNWEYEPLKSKLDKFRQGGMSYSPAITEFEDLMMNGELNHDGNPCTTMSVNVCQVETINNVQNSRRPTKNSTNLPNDAAIAILMAISTRELAGTNWDGENRGAFLDAITGGNNDDTMQTGLMDIFKGR